MHKKLLLIGASRGLGFALAEEYLNRGWSVVATERHADSSKLHGLTEKYGDRMEIETVDIVYPDQVSALHARLGSRKFNMLFVNALRQCRRQNADHETIADVSTDEFSRVMITHALSLMRVIELFQGVVLANGTIGIMSSGQGCVANVQSGYYEVYRGSKAALYRFMRSFAARHADDSETLLLMAPGWVRTDMGGPDARLSMEESVPNLADTMDAQAGKGGLQYLDYLGQTVSW